MKSSLEPAVRGEDGLCQRPRGVGLGEVVVAENGRLEEGHDVDDLGQGRRVHLAGPKKSCSDVR